MSTDGYSGVVFWYLATFAHAADLDSPRHSLGFLPGKGAVMFRDNGVFIMQFAQLWRGGRIASLKTHSCAVVARAVACQYPRSGLF